MCFVNTDSQHYGIQHLDSQDYEIEPFVDYYEDESESESESMSDNVNIVQTLIFEKRFENEYLQKNDIEKRLLNIELSINCTVVFICINVFLIVLNYQCTAVFICINVFLIVLNFIVLTFMKIVM